MLFNKVIAKTINKTLLRPKLGFTPDGSTTFDYLQRSVFIFTKEKYPILEAGRYMFVMVVNKFEWE